MTGRVSIGASPRELRRVKAVRVKKLKMDLEPVGPNHEVRRDCPIQQQGIKEYFRRTSRVPDGDIRKKQSGNTVSIVSH